MAANPSKPGASARRREFEYIRGGTQALIAGFEIMSGEVTAHCGNDRSAASLEAFMESLAATTGRPAFMVTVLTMYNDAAPDVAMGYYERCAAARARGNEVYIHANSHPLSFDFTLRDPYLMFSPA